MKNVRVVGLWVTMCGDEGQIVRIRRVVYPESVLTRALDYRCPKSTISLALSP